MDLSEPVGVGDHVRGNGACVLVMYGDFECPYCVAAQRIIPRVEARMGDDLSFVFRHFPLPEVHPHAQAAAEAGEAAAAQGRFWEMHAELYAADGRLEDADLVQAARRIGIDADRAEAELRDGTHRERVARDVRSGRASGVTGTPGFFANGRRVEGAFDAGSIVAALRRK